VLVPQLKKAASDEVTYRLTLLTLGEIGRVENVSGYPDAQAVLTAALSSPSEDVKAAASTALGAVTVGNVDDYLPFLLSKITLEVNVFLMLSVL
jgi:cullin-associated NEDD8-dissociated protein 1